MLPPIQLQSNAVDHHLQIILSSSASSGLGCRASSAVFVFRVCRHALHSFYGISLGVLASASLAHEGSPTPRSLCLLLSAVCCITSRSSLPLADWMFDFPMLPRFLSQQLAFPACYIDAQRRWGRGEQVAGRKLYNRVWCAHPVELILRFLI